MRTDLSAVLDANLGRNLLHIPRLMANSTPQAIEPTIRYVRNQHVQD